MINHKHKYIFIHIPKTAGSSIESFLNPSIKCTTNGDTFLKNKHESAVFYNTRDPNCFSKYFKFTFVRNPWDMVVSRYFYRKTKQSNFNISIKDFLLGNFNWIKYFNSLSIDGKICVDFIGKFENLEQDFGIVCDRIGIPRQKLPHRNKSNHKHYTEYYDDETHEIVAKTYAKDIEYFGYKFGD